MNLDFDPEILREAVEKKRKCEQGNCVKLDCYARCLPDFCLNFGNEHSNNTQKSGEKRTREESDDTAKTVIFIALGLLFFISSYSSV